jgi:serine/threonine-protein kinase RsbW
LNFGEWENRMGKDTGIVTEVCIPSDPNYLAKLRRIVGCLADFAGMDTKEVQDTKLAVSEACANAIRHGSPQGMDDRITVKFSSAAGTMVAEVMDPGNGFDPDNLPERLPSQPGGYGISLMRTLSDEVEFRREGAGMTVRLVKRTKRNAVRTRRLSR